MVLGARQGAVKEGQHEGVSLWEPAALVWMGEEGELWDKTGVWGGDV